jgi:peptidyl-prolyl cis-trans isomerase-like 4
MLLLLLRPLLLAPAGPLTKAAQPTRQQHAWPRAPAVQETCCRRWRTAASARKYGPRCLGVLVACSGGSAGHEHRQMAVLLETSQGDMVIDLHHEDCPIACKNFLKLCKMKHYNNCLFFDVQRDFMVRTGDPTNSGKNGESVYGKLYGEQASLFEDEIRKHLRHDKRGVVSYSASAENANGSTFFITTRGDGLEYLDDTHTIFGQVSEGLDTLDKINEAIVDDSNVPWQVIRIKHTIVLDDPFDDPPGIEKLIPPASPAPPPDPEGRLAEDVDIAADEFEGMTAEETEAAIRKREATSRKQTLAMIGDIPDEDVEPPDDTLFVCKLNPITEDEDLEIIFSRFGTIRSCNILRDKKSGDSLCYAFVEFEDVKACEEAFFKMENVLIDERRIHVDFSQSVGNLWNKYRRNESVAIHDRSGRGDYKEEKRPTKRQEADTLAIKGSARAYGGGGGGGGGGGDYAMVFDEGGREEGSAPTARGGDAGGKREREPKHKKEKKHKKHKKHKSGAREVDEPPHGRHEDRGRDRDRDRNSERGRDHRGRERGYEDPREPSRGGRGDRDDGRDSRDYRRR